MASTQDGKLHISETFGKVPVPLMHDKNITDGAVRLYAHMHWRYGQNKDNHESQESMAQFLGVTETTIRKRLSELEAHDWLVTIDRDRNASGNWTSCFYHVFELQAECRKFRETYQVADGESMRAKPATQHRKRRKGNPAPKQPPRANLSSDGDGVNLSSDGQPNLSSSGGANLSSHNLDSCDLDSSIQTQKEPAPTGADASKAPVEQTVDVTPSAGQGDKVLSITQRQKTDLMKAWWDALPDMNRPTRSQPPKIYQVKSYLEAAEAAIARGLTPEKMTYYVKAVTYQGQFWHDKILHFGKAAEVAPVWCKAHYRPPRPVIEPPDDDFELPDGMLSAHPDIDAALKNLIAHFTGKDDTHEQIRPAV